MNIKTATTSDTDRLIFIVALITSRLAGEALDTFLGLSRASGALRIADSIKHVFSVISTAASGAEIHCFLACCTGILTGLTYAAHSSIPTWAFSYTLRWIAFFFEKQWQALIDAAFRASCSSADACRARALIRKILLYTESCKCPSRQFGTGIQSSTRGISVYLQHYQGQGTWHKTGHNWCRLCSDYHQKWCRHDS